MSNTLKGMKSLLFSELIEFGKTYRNSPISSLYVIFSYCQFIFGEIVRAIFPII